MDCDTTGTELPASVLADLTGISIGNAERWSQWAKRDWAAYVGQRAADDDLEDIDSRKPAKNPLNMLNSTRIRLFSQLVGRFLAQLR
jgi:hypothetical protein